MAKVKVKKPIYNPIVMHRTRGIAGAVAQKIGPTWSVIAQGKFWFPNGPGGT